MSPPLKPTCILFLLLHTTLAAVLAEAPSGKMQQIASPDQVPEGLQKPTFNKPCPHSPPSGPSQWLFQEPLAESKLLVEKRKSRGDGKKR